jgi:hypothetical protein
MPHQRTKRTFFIKFFLILKNLSIRENFVKKVRQVRQVRFGAF